MRCSPLSVRLIPFIVSMSLLTVSCLGGRRLETLSPTPTPILGGSIFFEPSRVSAETKAVEVWLVNVSGQIPSVESAVVITEPATVQKMTMALVGAVSGMPLVELPAAEPGDGYLLALYLYSREDVPRLSGASASWLLASVTYNYHKGFIVVDRPSGQGERNTETYTVGSTLLEILEREFMAQGLTLPR